ncbi:hypothetical protein DFS33DRAFT_1279827 [Desarmillaria ectypa]|nr:hypothetical protein DFS33DRAFT_1279827 [Desarmillaria ectypa]
MWQTYMRESTTDICMVGECRENLDMLLVFTGLFSAVVTTFIVQTYQNLQADYTWVSAMLLFELVSIQRAFVNELRSIRIRCRLPILQPNLFLQMAVTAEQSLSRSRKGRM